MKAISAIIATIMLLMISVSLIGVFYVFSSGLTTSSTSSASEQTSQLTKQLSSCMKIDNIYNNQVLLTNCGKGTIENKSLVVMMDDVVLGASTNTINEDSSGVVNISGLWKIAPGKHSLKISNGAAVAQNLVDVQPNRDGLVGSWNFDEGSGNKANDGSGNGNIGTLLPAGSEPTWVSGKFNKGLQFDGTNDYVDAGNGASLNIVNAITIEVWVKFSGNNTDYNNIISKSSTTYNYAEMMAVRVSDGYTLWYSNINENNVFWTMGQEPSLLSGWHSLVGTYDKDAGTNNMNFYIDGVLKYQQTKIGSFSAEPNISLKIGWHPRPEYRFSGTIDEVRIWSKALAPDETVIMKQII